MTRPKALIIDDDKEFADSLALLVDREGFDSEVALDLESAAAALAKDPLDVVLVDRRLPDGDGLAFAEDTERLAGAEVIVITGNADVESAVLSLRRGVLDYLTKPVDRSRLKTSLANVARTRSLKADVNRLRGELRRLGRFERMIGRSTAMQPVYDMITRVAPTQASVMIMGESGTGKEVVAQTIHDISDRRGKPLVAVNCGAIPDSLIESELFGHEKGSFTGADRTRKGFFERADGGTLFLDEVTEMPLEAQVKLLRVLETSEVQRVGGAKPHKVDVRVLAATNRDPLEAVEKGKLRQDLYYRLAVFPLELPPLRERRGDVALLAQFFLERLNADYDTSKSWSDTALQKLEADTWEGNVRELKNAVHRAFIMGEDEIGPSAVSGPNEIRPATQPGGRTAGNAVQVEVGASIADAEQRLILATLEHTDGDKQAAAKILGISLKTLYNRLKVYEAAGA